MPFAHPIRGRGTRAWLMVGGLLVACSDPAPQPAETPTRPRAESATPEKSRLYDARGQLLESERELLGVRLPRGLEPDPDASRDRHHVFRSHGIEIDKLIAYFGPRLFTGQIERLGKGIVYRRAAPMEKRNAQLRMDVAISPVGPLDVKVSIHEYALPPLKTPSVGTLQKTLLREQKQIE